MINKHRHASIVAFVRDLGRGHPVTRDAARQILQDPRTRAEFPSAHLKDGRLVLGYGYYVNLDTKAKGWQAQRVPLWRKVCQQCGTAFEARDRRRVYCGQRCAGLSNAENSREQMRKIGLANGTRAAAKALLDMRALWPGIPPEAVLQWRRDMQRAYRSGHRRGRRSAYADGFSAALGESVRGPSKLTDLEIPDE